MWLDEEELQVGDSIVAGVSQGLKNADYLVAVLSKTSIGSRWIQAELNASLMEELSVAPEQSFGTYRRDREEGEVATKAKRLIAESGSRRRRRHDCRTCRENQKFSHTRPPATSAAQPSFSY